MRTGRLSISRGHQILARLERGAPAEPLLLAPVSFRPAPAISDLERVHVRVSAIERLARLVEQGILSSEEFREEKALVLRLTSDELLLSEPAPPEAPHVGPSLAGRLLGWRFILAAAVASAGLSWATQPEATLALLNDGAAWLGV